MALSFEEATKPFVAEVSAYSLEEALVKFSGRRTAKTVMAASRIAEKKHRVTIPAHFFRRLWSLTGGWKTPVTTGWKIHTLREIKPAVYICTLSGIQIFTDPNDESVLFKVGDRKVAHLPKGQSWPYRVWSNEEKAKAALVALAGIN